MFSLNIWNILECPSEAQEHEKNENKYSPIPCYSRADLFIQIEVPKQIVLEMLSNNKKSDELKKPDKWSEQDSRTLLF